VAEYTCGMTASIAGTSTLPILSIAGSSTFSAILLSFSIWNTTAVACAYRLVRFTGGTAGAGQTEIKTRLLAPAASATVAAGHTAAVTVGDDLGYRVYLPGTIGAGAIVPLGGGIETPTSGTTPGIGLVSIGTGQICEIMYRWSE
jgi:hypothetical protein